MTDTVRYSHYRYDVIIIPCKSYEIRCRRRLLSEGSSALGGAISVAGADASRGDRREPRHPGELPTPATHRTQTRRFGRESEGSQRRISARAASRPDHDGGCGRDNRGRLCAGGLSRGWRELLVSS